MKAKLFSRLEEKICSFSTFHVEEEEKKKALPSHRGRNLRLNQKAVIKKKKKD